MRRATWARRTTTETYTVDVTAPAPTITLTSNITADDVINAAEAGGNIAITGTVGGDADDGDTVTLTVNGTNYTGTVSRRADLLASTCRARRWWRMRTSPSRRRSARRMRRATSGTARRHRDLHGRRDRAGADDHADLEHHGRRRHQRRRSRRQRSRSPARWAASRTSATRDPDGERRPNYTGTVAGGQHFSINVPGAALVADADFTIQASISSTDAAGNVGTATDDRDLHGGRDRAGADDHADLEHHGRRRHQRGRSRRQHRDHRHGGRRRRRRRHRDPDGERHRTTPARCRAGAFSINVPGAALVADADFTIQASISSTDAAGNVGTAHGHRELHGRRDRAGADDHADLEHHGRRRDQRGGSRRQRSRSPARWAARRTTATRSP